MMAMIMSAANGSMKFGSKLWRMTRAQLTWTPASQRIIVIKEVESMLPQLKISMFCDPIANEEKYVEHSLLTMFQLGFLHH